MKTILAFILLIIALTDVSAQEISNDEYNRLKVARQKFSEFDSDKNGILNQKDINGIRSPYIKSQFVGFLEIQGEINKEDYISHFKTSVEKWDGEIISNVVYKEIGETKLMLDIYLPPNVGKKKIPLVLFFHGGGLSNGRKEGIGIKRDVVEQLARQQIAYVSANYRLINFKDIFAKDCITDAKDVLRFLRKEGHKYGLDADKVVTWGISAGARLAMMLSLTDENNLKGDEELFDYPVKPVGAISWCGATAFYEIIDDSMKNSPLLLKYMKKITLEEDEETVNNEIKKKIMFKTNEVASKQEQGLLNDKIDLSDLVANIIVNTDTETSTLMIDTLSNFLDDSNSKLSLKVVKNLTKYENFEDKLQIISDQTVIDAGNVKKLISNAIKQISSESEINIFKKIVIDNNDFITDIIIDIGNEGDKSNEIKVIKILDEIIKEDPIKVQKIIKDNKEKKIIKKIIKPKKPKVIKEIPEIYPIDVSPN